MLYKLNSRVKVIRWGASKNEFGGLQALELASWYKWAEVRASNWINLDLFNTRSGRANDDFNQQKWDYDTTIILRYEKERPTRSNDTIEYDGASYIINSITVNNEYSRNYEVIKCSKVDEKINSDTPMDTGSIKYYSDKPLENEYEITVNLLIGKNIFGCYKDGIMYNIVNSFTPGGESKEVIINTTTGEFTWSTYFSGSESFIILYW